MLYAGRAFSLQKSIQTGIGICLLLLSPLFVVAQTPCDDLRLLYRDKGVESEVFGQDQIAPLWNLIDSIDGKARGILSGHPVPPELLEYAKSQSPDRRLSESEWEDAARDLSWLKLPIDLRRQVLQHAIRERYHYFFRVESMLQGADPPPSLITWAKKKFKDPSLTPDQLLAKIHRLEWEEIPSWIEAQIITRVGAEKFSFVAEDRTPMLRPDLRLSDVLEPEEIPFPLSAWLKGRNPQDIKVHNLPAKMLSHTLAAAGSQRLRELERDWRASQMEDGYPRKTRSEVARLKRQPREEGLAIAKARAFRDFLSQQSIPGTKVRRQVRLDFPKDMDLFGKHYTAGTHSVPIAQYLDPVIETLTFVRRKANGLEVKVRAGQHEGMKASEVVRDTWRLQDLLGIRRTPFHVHVVNKSPDNVFAVSLVEMNRRLETYENLRTLSRAQRLPIVGRPDYYLWAPADAVDYGDMIDMVMPPHNPQEIVSDFPELGMGMKNMVGIRGSDLYGMEDGKHLLGMDFRSVNPGDPDIESTLNRTEILMTQPDFGVDRELLKFWRKMVSRKLTNDPNSAKIPLKPYRELLPLAAWNHPLPESPTEAIPANVLKLLTQIENRKGGSDNVVKGHLEVRMLVHDWSNDPLLFANPKALERVRSAQKIAIERLIARHDVGFAMKWFTLESGLLELYAKSLEMPTPAALVPSPFNRATSVR